MKTTLNIPDELFAEVQKELNIGNKTTLVIMGLQELLHQNRIKRLRKYRGKLDLQVDLNTLRNRGNE